MHGVETISNEPEWREKPQKLGGEEKASDEHLEQFRKEMPLQDVYELFRLSPRWYGEGGEVEASIVWLARVHHRWPFWKSA